jgi:hypothetical protein
MVKTGKERCNELKRSLATSTPSTCKAHTFSIQARCLTVQFLKKAKEECPSYDLENIKKEMYVATG